MTIILQHEPSTPPGSLIEWLIDRQQVYRVHKIFENPILPQLSEFQNLIICGGSMDVDQEAKYPWLKPEKILIKQAIAENKKVLGLCLGGQLIAEVLGSKVGPMNFAEAGWMPMQIQTNAVWGVPPMQLSVFQWHSYCFSDVPGANMFAANTAWPYQGFSYSENVIGFQFHPESTKAWIIECANHKKFPQGAFCQKPQEILQQLDKQEIMQDWFFKGLDHFFLMS